MNVEIDADAFEVRDDHPTYEDGLARLLDWEAHQSLAEGDYPRAKELFQRLVRLDPDDAHALRELGRTAAATGAPALAAAALQRCAALLGDLLDPELHYLRGEALLALNRPDEADAELERARAQLQLAPDSTDKTLWLARIHMLRGDAAIAVTLLSRLLAEARAGARAREAILSLAEAHIVSGDPAEAEQLLTEYVLTRADQRAEDLLAWALEARGEIDEEVLLRETLSRRWDGATAPSLVGYARSLERANRPEDALDAYRDARDRGNSDVASHIARLETALAPKAVAIGERRTDPTGEITAVIAAMEIPFGPRVRVSATAVHERIADEVDASLSAVTMWALARARTYGQLGVGGTSWRDPTGSVRAGASLVAATSSPRWPLLAGRADYALPWRDSAASVRDGGAATGLELQGYARPWPSDVLLVAAVRARRFELPGIDGRDELTGTQAFGSFGLDWVAHRDAARSARAYVVDRHLLVPSHVGSTLTFSLRHNEVSAGGDRPRDLGLVDRSTADEVSASYRWTTGDSMFSAGIDAGLGYDWRRRVDSWRVRAQLLVSPTSRVRLMMAAGADEETSAAGATGRRSYLHAGVHADL